MNIIQRLIGLWWSLWAAASGLEVQRVAPLPPPVAAPVSVAALIAEAEERGDADARSAMADAWTFGGPGDREAEAFDPDYVRLLRHRCDSTVESMKAALAYTDVRVEPARRQRDEARARMADARTQMSKLAARDELVQLQSIDGAEPDPQEPADPPAADADHTPWEGETVPLPLLWRLLILGGLVGAELPVQFYVFSHFLGQGSGVQGLARWLALATSAIVVFGPFVAGSVLRVRAATGADRRTGYAILVLVAGWLFSVAVLGLIRGRMFAASVAKPDTAHVTPLTIVLMFVALLLVIGAMSFMLGLARRHPFQEAYVRQRTRGDRFETMMRTMATRINPAYADPENRAAAVEAQEGAIREAFAAAENAYFAALARTNGDPAFTEAVQHRRGARAVAS